MTEALVDTEEPFRDLTLSDRPPVKTVVDFKLGDGSVVMGWRIYDTVINRSVYWAWTRAAPPPSKVTSRWDIAGMTPIKPVAWRPRPAAVVRPPHDIIARREAEVLVHRAILTDGTMRQGYSKGVRSTWDDSWHTDPDWQRNVGNQIGMDLTTMVKFRPTPRDQQNYDDGTVLRWFANLRPANAKRPGFSEEQTIVVLYAYGLSFELIGGKLKRAPERVKERYSWAIDRIWSKALEDHAGVRRLPRALWADPEN
jgi:hypothetical protein